MFSLLDIENSKITFFFLVFEKQCLKGASLGQLMVPSQGLSIKCCLNHRQTNLLLGSLTERTRLERIIILSENPN